MLINTFSNTITRKHDRAMNKAQGWESRCQWFESQAREVNIVIVKRRCLSQVSFFCCYVQGVHIPWSLHYSWMKVMYAGMHVIYMLGLNFWYGDKRLTFWYVDVGLTFRYGDWGLTFCYWAKGLTFQNILYVYIAAPQRPWQCEPGSAQVKISLCVARQYLCESFTHSVYLSFIMESRDPVVVILLLWYL